MSSAESLYPSKQTPSLKVLISINVRWWNAEAAYAINAARGLIDLGCQVWVIVNDGSLVHDKAIDHQIPAITDIHLDSTSPFVQWFNYRKLIKIIEQKQIQVINSFKSNGAFLFTLLKKRFPYLTYIKTRGEARVPKNHFLNRYLYGVNACDGIISVSHQVEQWVKDLAPNNPIQTIYYGDSALKSTPGTSAGDIRRQLSIPSNAIVLALVGRTQKIKGHSLLLEALHLLRNREIHILFLVKDLKENPEELIELENYVTNKKLTNQVTILGFQNNLGDIMRIIDIGVIPSTESEVNCRVSVEFFSMGIPVIAFPTGSLPEIVEHQRTGLICQQKTSQSLKESIEELSRSDYRMLGENAYNAFKARFDLPVFSQAIHSFYIRHKTPGKIIRA